MNRIAWSRIFPFGTKNSPINSMGLQHYIDGDRIVNIQINVILIAIAVAKYCLSLGISPIVTLCQWAFRQKFSM